MLWNFDIDIAGIPSSSLQLIKEIIESVFKFQEAFFETYKEMIWFSPVFIEPIGLPYTPQGCQTCGSRLQLN